MEGDLFQDHFLNHRYKRQCNYRYTPTAQCREKVSFDNRYYCELHEGKDLLCKVSHLELLPPETWDLILSYLSPWDIKGMSSVCYLYFLIYQKVYVIIPPRIPRILYPDFYYIKNEMKDYYIDHYIYWDDPEPYHRFVICRYIQEVERVQWFDYTFSSMRIKVEVDKKLTRVLLEFTLTEIINNFYLEHILPMEKYGYPLPNYNRQTIRNRLRASRLL